VRRALLSLTSHEEYINVGSRFVAACAGVPVASLVARRFPQLTLAGALMRFYPVEAVKPLRYESLQFMQTTKVSQNKR
jgi:hypothetical protein